MTDKSTCIWTQEEITEKLGYQFICGKQVRLSLYQEEASNQINYVLTCVVDIVEKSTLSSIFQEQVKYILNCTKNLNNLKMDWYMTPDTDTTVAILEVRGLSFSQTINLILASCPRTGGDSTVSIKKKKKQHIPDYDPPY